MPINFPDSPSLNDTHTVGDKTWTWDGTAWNVVVGGIPTSISELTITNDLTVDTDTLHVDSTNDRVGIGTTSPSQTLDVNGTAHVGSLATTDGTTNSRGILVSHQNNINYSFVGRSEGGVTDTGNRLGWDYDDDSFDIKTGGNTRLTIDSSGNVGIGTTTPSYTLHVNGSARTSTLDTSNLIFDNYTNTNQPIARLYSYASGSVAAWSSGCTSDSTRNHMRFSSPSYPAIGAIYTFSGNTYYANYSDYRLKDNVAPLTNASDIVANLNPVSYTMRHNPETTHVGFLAHELQEHIPSAVGGTKDAVDDEGNPVYQNVDLSKMVPVLTAALQEALTTIDQLTARIEALEAN